MDPTYIIKRPIITEKSTRLIREENKYTFCVDKKAKENQIKEAVEKLFGVRVVDVNIINMPGKTKRRGRRRRLTKVPGFKKAIVKLAKGDKIETFATGE